MANPADKYATKTFSQLESQISQMYREAYKDISKKLAEFTKKHKAKDKQMQRDLKKGKITPEQYAQWMTGQVFIGKQWASAKASIDATIKNVMNEASSLTHNKSIDVFVDNANYTAYQIEQGFSSGISFDLYDRKTVSRLILEDPELLPRRRDIDGNKLEAWNTKIIANCVSQAIIQGESIDELSKRIARDTSIGAGRSSLLYARTAMTGAQNAGRVERMKEAQGMGVKVRKQWMATLDSRTRDTHAMLDGEMVDVNGTFSNGLKYPGDPDGEPREVYNCRCTLTYVYPGYSSFSNMERTAYYEEGDPEYDPRHRNYETVKGMNYKQWTKYKQEQRQGGEVRPEKPSKKPVNDHTGDPMYDFSDLEQERKEQQRLEQAARDSWEEYRKLDQEAYALMQERSRLTNLGSTLGYEDIQAKRDEINRRLEEIKKQKDEAMKKYEEDSRKAYAWNSAKLVDTAQKNGVEYSVPMKLEKPLSTDEIVARLGGGDMTQGSCASLGFCYIGQKDGYDVLDFRDGASRELFARHCDDILRGISRETGRPLLIERTSTGTGGSVKLIKQCVPGKEYYFSCGRHAAIVRSDENGRLEYMELQSRFRNGWKLLGYKDDRRSMDYTFSNRFGCSRSVNGTAYMMDIEDMKDSKILRRTYGYMNTAEDKQRKGASGYER